MIVISEIALNELSILREISITTFLDTYGAVNTKENMDNYLEKSFSMDQLKQDLQNPLSLFYFARIDNTPVGYIKLNLAGAQTELNDPGSVEIERIYVLKSHQGKKIGRALIEKTLEVAAGRNLNHVWLGVWEKNPKAIEFYKKNGFVASETHTFYLGDDPQNDVIMKRTLKS